MQLYLIGLNHKTAPIDIREKFYLTPLQQDLFLSELKNRVPFLQAFIISTCNRTEIYTYVLDDFSPFDSVLEIIARIKEVNQPENFRNYFYILTEKNAVEHLLNVVCGLDSLVLGEKQILGQIKNAVDRGRKLDMFQKELNLLTAVTIRAGKKAQTETQISFGGSSISWAAMTKAEHMLGTLEGKSILIIGAGKMSELAVGQIQNKNFSNLYVMNRTPCNAEFLAEKYGGTAVGFCDLKEKLIEVDICICCAGAPHYVLEKIDIEKIMSERSAHELILIDISMPRNIDPSVKNIPDVHLFEIDDLNEVVDSNMKTRESAISDVKTIIQDKLNEFYQKLKPLSHEPAVS